MMVMGRRRCWCRIRCLLGLLGLVLVVGGVIRLVLTLRRVAIVHPRGGLVRRGRTAATVRLRRGRVFLFVRARTREVGLHACVRAY